MESMTYIGKGLYTISRAASLVGEKPTRLRSWISRSSSIGPVIERDFQRVEGEVSLSFLDLVELRLIAKLRSEGFSLQWLRKTHRFMKEQLDVAHPFASYRLETDGRDFFICLVEEASAREVMLKVSGANRGHTVFDTVVRPYFRSIDFSNEAIALRWYPRGKNGSILIDPHIAFGEPVLAGTRIPTRALFGLLRAGDVPTAVARWYGITVEDVNAAWEFEDGLSWAA